MGKHIIVTLHPKHIKVRPKSAKIYTPKRYDEHPRHFFTGVPQRFLVGSPYETLTATSFCLPSGSEYKLLISASKIMSKQCPFKCLFL